MAGGLKGWENLSPSYRARLLGAAKSGKLTGSPITGKPATIEKRARAAYEGGRVNISRATGHTKRARAAAERGTSRSLPAAAPRSRPGERRTGWSRLSNASQNRITAAGRAGRLTGAPLTNEEARRYWEAGGDVRGAYGHKPKRRRGAAPLQATLQASLGQESSAELAALRSWRDSTAPKWLPDRESMGDNTAAILSNLPNPNTWANVELQFTGGRDDPVVMIVTPKNGYPITVVLPDTDSASEVGQMIRDKNHPGLTVDAKGQRYRAPNVSKTQADEEQASFRDAATQALELLERDGDEE